MENTEASGMHTSPQLDVSEAFEAVGSVNQQYTEEDDDDDGSFASAHDARSQMSEQSVAFSVDDESDRLGANLTLRGEDTDDLLEVTELESSTVTAQPLEEPSAADEWTGSGVQDMEVEEAAAERGGVLIDAQPEDEGAGEDEEVAAELAEASAASAAAVEGALDAVSSAVHEVAAEVHTPPPQQVEQEDSCPIDVGGIISRTVNALSSADDESVPPAPAAAAAVPSISPPAKAPAGGLGAPAGLGGGLPTLPARPARRTPAPTQPAPTQPAPTQTAQSAAPSGMPSLPPRTAQPARAPPATASPAAGNPSGPNLSARAPLGVAPAAAAEPVPEEPEKVRQMRRKVQALRVTLIRAALRLGHSPRSSIVQQVIYRLDLAERIHHPPRVTAAGRRNSSMDSAAAEAAALEEAGGQEELPLSFTVMCIGPVGGGKSSTINSLLGYDAVPVNTMEQTAKKVRVVEGVVRGIRMKFIDTPGLRTAASQISSNISSLHQMHKSFKRHSPDLVLYFDRMDVVRRDMCDLPLLRQITDKFGSSMWFNTLVVLTHATAPPPEGMNGAMSRDLFLNSRTHMLQNAIRQAAGDMRLLNPTALVENEVSACSTNDAGEPLLADGNPWKQNLMLLCLSSKLLSDTDDLLEIQSAAQSGNRAMQFLRAAQTVKLPPIAYLLSNFLVSKHPRKPPEDERDIKRDDEMDELPAEVRKEEVRKKREFVRQRAEEAKAEENASQVPVPAPDPQLPPTFDSDSAVHRYRFLEAAGGWIARPFVEQAGLDHDDGIDGFSIERPTVLRPQSQYLGGVPFYIMSQIHKDKNQFSLTGEAEGSAYHSSRHVTTGTLEVQTIGKDMMYTSKLESRLKPTKKTKTSIGAIASRLTEGHGLPTKGPVALGLKLEQKVKVAPNMKVTASAGTMGTKSRVGRDSAHGANAEIKMKGIVDESAQLLLGGTVMHYRKDMALGGNIAGQFNVTPETQLSSRFNLNSKGTGQLVVRCSSHDYPQLGYSLLVPVLGALWNKIRGDEVY